MGRMLKYKRMQSVATIAEDDGGHNKERKREASEWVVNINAILKSGVVYYSGKKWTVYRVPTNLLKIQKKAFLPKIISIGPFHYKDPRLRVMDEHKERYLFRLLGGKLSKSLSKELQGEAAAVVASSSSCSAENNNGGGAKAKVTLEALETAMRDIEIKTRETYSEVVTMSREKFVEMMVLDGCFIIELLRLFHKSRTVISNSPDLF